MTSTRRLLSFFVLLSLCARLSGAETDRKTTDAVHEILAFEEANALARWKGQAGKPEAQVVAVKDDATTEDGGPSGSALYLKGPAKSFYYSATGALPPDLARFSTLCFWLRSDHPKGELEVQFIEDGGKARFWRRVPLAGTGWQNIEVPLRFMRWSSGRRPQWSGVKHFGIHFRTPAAVTLDRIRLRVDPPHQAALSPAELSRLAFPGAETEDLRTVLDGRFSLLSDSEKLDMPAVAKHLETVVEALGKDFPFLDITPRTPPALVVFAQDKAYRTFPQRLGKALLAQAPSPGSDGYTLRAIATTAYSDRFGTIRPVYTHEFVHAWLEMNGLLASGSGDWVQEGVANLYQLRNHPQANFGALVIHGMASPDRHLPLAELCSGQRLKISQYWQALTFMQMLLETPRYRRALPKLFAAFRERASTDLRPLAAPILKTDMDTLATEWVEFSRQKYGRH